MEWRLLRGVPPDHVHQLLQIARRRTFSRGEVVFHREDPADSLHLIVKGRFAIRVMTPLGDTATIALGRGLRPGQEQFGLEARIDVFLVEVKLPGGLRGCAGSRSAEQVTVESDADVVR